MAKPLICLKKKPLKPVRNVGKSNCLIADDRGAGIIFRAIQWVKWVKSVEAQAQPSAPEAEDGRMKPHKGVGEST